VLLCDKTALVSGSTDGSECIALVTVRIVRVINHSQGILNPLCRIGSIMFGLEYGQRLGQLDYERFGINENWCFTDTLLMLTSFEMEIRGFYDKPDSNTHYEKVYDKYNDFMMECMYSEKFEYNSGNSKEEKERNVEIPGYFSFDLDKANFKKDLFVDYIATISALKVDIERLRRFICGEESPVIGTTAGKKVLYVTANVDLPETAGHIKKGVQGANERWQPNKEKKQQIKQHVLGSIRNGCICNHAQLAKHIESERDEVGEMLLAGTGVANLSENVVKLIIKDLFHELGIPRVKGDPGVKDTKNCPLHPAMID
jgi:hypothetical protein